MEITIASHAWWNIKRKRNVNQAHTNTHITAQDLQKKSNTEASDFILAHKGVALSPSMDWANISLRTK